MKRPRRTTLVAGAALPFAPKPSLAELSDLGPVVGGDDLPGLAAGVIRATGFQGKAGRLATLYGPEGPSDGPGMAFTALPPMESGAGGLGSTVPDFPGFMQMMLARGQVDGQPLSLPAHFGEMVRDQLTADQRSGLQAAMILGAALGWGPGLGVVHEGRPFGLGAGSFGWTCGYGTCADADPTRERAGVLTTPAPPDDMMNFRNEEAR